MKLSSRLSGPTFVPLIYVYILFTKVHIVESSIFTDSLSKISSLGTIIAEDVSDAFTKSVSSVKTIAQCPFGECCNLEYIPANFSGKL